MEAWRLSSGVPGLDEILHGGLPNAQTYLVTGGAGTGKTLLSLQWALHGRDLGERVLIVTLAEREVDLARDVEGFGWTLDGVRILDLSPTGQENDEASEYAIFPPSEVERVQSWRAIRDAVLEYQPSRVIIDSVTQLHYLSTDEYQFRKHLLNLVNFLKASGCTALFPFEPSELLRDASVGLAVDGVLRLDHRVSPLRRVGLRSIHVDKLRSSDFMSGVHPLRIGSQGVRIFPHRVEGGGARCGGEILGTGLPALDQLLCGGLPIGSTTIVTGPTGAGKSTLAAQLAAHAARNGLYGTIVSFEETTEKMLARCAGVSIDLAGAVDDGSLRLAHVDPVRLYPDELLARIREEVTEHGRRFVVLDSLRSYEIAMEEFGNPSAHLHNLIAFLEQNGVTTVLINEMSQIIGDVTATEMGISHLADNLLMLRYAELEGRVIKLIGCIKKRLGPFEPELRELRITGEGIVVGERLSGMRGLLTGIPVAGAT